MITSAIITIGDEILLGQILDTNSQFMARELTHLGVETVHMCSVADERAAILGALTRALQQADIVLVTGGLGPTKDDITKYTLAKFFSSDFREDDAVARHVKTMLEARGILYNELNHSQAVVPEKCTVLFNHHGTAPGMWFEDAERRVTISLPGVPFEMEHLMEDEVMPRLKAHFSLNVNIHRTMITAGLPESMLAEKIATWEEALPAHIKLAYLPAPNVVRLRLSTYDAIDETAAREEINALFAQLNDIIPQHIVGFEEASMQALVHDLLTQRQQTLSTAESCTGGVIASRFTAMAGASAYFNGGVIAYANEVKIGILGVNAEDIERYGAVSESVARQMAEGARQATGSDYAIATTGIAGPTGGTKEKPIGTVWMAVATPTHTITALRNCGTDRGQIINRATAYAIEMLYKELKNNTNK